MATKMARKTTVSKPEQYKHEAIQQLETLRNDFTQAATDILQAKRSFWPRIESKQARAAKLQKYADYTQQTIDRLQASKPLERTIDFSKTHPKVAPPQGPYKASGDMPAVFAPFDRMTKAVSSHAKIRRSKLSLRFSMFRHATKQDAALYEGFKSKAKAITPKIWQAFGIIP